MDSQDGSGLRENPLAFVSEGMKVIDQEGEEIGTVERVYAGQVPPEGVQGAERNTPDESDMAREGLWDAMEDVFDPVDQLKEDLRADLWRSGFLRVRGPELRGEKRYIGPHRVSDVSGDEVHLSVSLDELVRI